MATSNDQSPAGQLLENYPNVRERVELLPEYVQWRSALRMVTVDEEVFFVIGGDRLMDNDQILVEWIRLFRPELMED
jgi:hypothetical protein